MCSQVDNAPAHYGVAALPYTITQRVVFIVFGGASIGFASYKTTTHKSGKCQISTLPFYNYAPPNTKQRRPSEEVRR